MITTAHEIHTTDCECLVVAQEWRHGIDGMTVEMVDVDLGVIYFASSVSLNAFAGPNPHGGYHMTKGAAIALASSLLRAALNVDDPWVRDQHGEEVITMTEEQVRRLWPDAPDLPENIRVE